MTEVRDRIRVLELRSVRGTGGGPEKTILHGAARADPTRFAVTVCCLRDGRDAVFEVGARAGALAVDYVEVCERHSFDHRIWPALVSTVRQRRIDIVHAHDYKTDLLALALARATGVTPLSTVHGWIHDSWRERRIYCPADRRLLRWFPRVIAVSDTIRATLIESGVAASRISTLLNGIDPARFRRVRHEELAARRELGVEPAEIVIGAVGRLEPVKRFDVLLHAVARLQWAHRATNRVIKLFVVGDGSLRDTLMAKATELGIEGCRFLGHRADVARLHHAFDVFVQSSDSEGTPNAVLEAMALETPVVATDAGGTRDIVGHDVHGLVVRCGDARALADAIERTLVDWRATLTRVAAARARIERELSFDRRMRTLECVYEDMVAQHHEPASK